MRNVSLAFSPPRMVVDWFAPESFRLMLPFTVQVPLTTMVQFSLGSFRSAVMVRSCMVRVLPSHV